MLHNFIISSEMKVPDWISSADFTFVFDSADIIRPLIPGTVVCELAKVGMKDHDGKQIEYLHVGEGVKKGTDKYICTKIRVIVGGNGKRTVKLQFVKILGMLCNTNLTQLQEPSVSGSTTKEPSEEPNSFEKKCCDIASASLDEFDIAITENERNAIDEWL